MKFYFLGLILSYSAYAQEIGAHAEALGGLDLRTSLLNNPAQALPKSSNLIWGAKLNFQITNLNSTNLSYNYSDGRKNLTFGMDHFGNDHYQSTRIHAAYGMALSKNLGLAISLHAKRLFLVEQDSKYNGSASVFWDYHPNDKWSWAGSVLLVDQTYLRSQFIYSGSEGFNLLAGLKVGVNNPGNFALALEYNVKKVLFLRQGLLLYNELDFRSGIGLRWLNFILDICFQWKRALGLEQSLNLGYRW